MFYFWRSRRDGYLRILDAVDRKDAIRYLGGAFTHLRTMRCDPLWLMSHPMNSHFDTQQQLREAAYNGAKDDAGVRAWIRSNRALKCV